MHQHKSTTPCQHNPLQRPTFSDCLSAAWHTSLTSPSNSVGPTAAESCPAAAAAADLRAGLAPPLSATAAACTAACCCCLVFAGLRAAAGSATGVAAAAAAAEEERGFLEPPAAAADAGAAAAAGVEVGWLRFSAQYTTPSRHTWRSCPEGTSCLVTDATAAKETRAAKCSTSWHIITRAHNRAASTSPKQKATWSNSYWSGVTTTCNLPPSRSTEAKRMLTAAARCRASHAQCTISWHPLYQEEFCPGLESRLHKNAGQPAEVAA